MKKLETVYQDANAIVRGKVAEAFILSYSSSSPIRSLSPSTWRAEGI
jgi:hypothetical protein